MPERYEKNAANVVILSTNSIGMTLDICPSPALYPFYREENDTVIVVDIFRASTTMCAMLHNGAAAVIPVADIEAAKRYKSHGYLVGAERNTRRCDFAHGGNSPFDYPSEKVSGREVVFTTTNGTQAIEAARGCGQLLVGAFANIDALAEKCIADNCKRVVVLCAGWNNKINVEDTLFGGAFAEKLAEKTDVALHSDAVKIALQLWCAAKPNPLTYVKSSEHYARLIANGVESEAAYCLRQNTVAAVPRYDKETGRLTI